MYSADNRFEFFLVVEGDDYFLYGDFSSIAQFLCQKALLCIVGGFILTLFLFGLNGTHQFFYFAHGQTILQDTLVTAELLFRGS